MVTDSFSALALTVEQIFLVSLQLLIRVRSVFEAIPEIAKRHFLFLFASYGMLFPVTKSSPQCYPT